MSLIARLCCYFGRHEVLWDRVEGVAVFRCQNCLKVRAR